MENLLHYVWKHRLFPLRPLVTTDGETVDVLDPGLHNSNAGPDFFNAKLRVDGVVWAGNVEIHAKSSDWHTHGHDRDAAYDSVVMHVVGRDDGDAFTSSGKRLRQLVLEIPEHVTRNYDELLRSDRYPPCHGVIKTLPRLTLHSFMSRLAAERLDRKRAEVEQRVERCRGSWEQALFMTMARGFGFGVNGDAFEEWGRSVPLAAASHHRDNAMQVEALFMGQAGLLDVINLPESRREAASNDEWFVRLAAEYKYLSRKFGLEPMPNGMWRFMRMRPQNSPCIRIAQMAEMYRSGRCNMAALLDCRSVDDLRRLLRTGTTPYWETHYAFGSSPARRTKVLTEASADSLMINVVVPVFAAYARHRGDERLHARAVELLEALPPERNGVVSAWHDCGLTACTAADSQALIQLKRRYCERKDCLRCRFGFEMLRSGSYNPQR